MDLGCFGMNLHWFEYIWECFEFGDLDAKDDGVKDKYWQTEQLFHRFNDHYSNIITHGTYVNVDERMFCSYARASQKESKFVEGSQEEQDRSARHCLVLI